MLHNNVEPLLGNPAINIGVFICIIIPIKYNRSCRLNNHYCCGRNLINISINIILAITIRPQITKIRFGLNITTITRLYHYTSTVLYNNSMRRAIALGFIILLFFVSSVPKNTHSANTWHSPEYTHHHGANPATSNLYNLYISQTGHEIGYPWLSSPTENTYPFPEGKHEGFFNLLENNTNCDQTGRVGGLNCINAYLLQIHTLGMDHALYTRVHSQYGVFKVCNKAGTQCGYVTTGGWADYGVMHNGYKRQICQLDSDPYNYPYNTPEGLNHLPYRVAINTTLLPPNNLGNIQFWNSMGPSGSHIQYYPHLPNNILGLSWSSIDAWNYVDGLDCSNPSRSTAPCPDGSCNFNHTKFQIFAIKLQNLPTQRPFVGFTNVWGHIDPNCTTTSSTCIPLSITANTPQGDALLSRGVRQGKCDEIQCFDFDNGQILQMPGYNNTVR